MRHRSNPFGRPVAHGLLGLAIATGLMSQAPRVDTLAFLAILEWKFHQPIVFGDTIHAVSLVSKPWSRKRTVAAASSPGTEESSIRMDTWFRKVAPKRSSEPGPTKIAERHDPRRSTTPSQSDSRHSIVDVLRSVHPTTDYTVLTIHQSSVT